MKLILDPHQVSTVEYMVANPYTICALDMGLGKSLCALATWNQMGRPKLLIVCPSYLVLNWKWEIEKSVVSPGSVSIFKKGKELYEIFDSDIVIISYNLAQKSEQLFEWAEMVVLDEGHEIKSMKAKRTEYIHRVVFENSINRLYILTGTPIKNRVEEYYSLLALCNYDPRLACSYFLEKFPDSITFADYFSHRREFATQISGRWITIVKWEGVRRTDELKEFLNGHYIRFASEDVLKLPVPRHKDILISESPDKALLREFERYYSTGGNESVVPDKKAEAALKKVPFTIQYVKSLLEEIDCVPIYTDHRASAYELAKAFNVEPITGEMSGSKRMQLGQQFQRGESRVLVATVRSFSTGIDLSRANHLCWNDYPWIPGDIRQVNYRILRRNQTKPCIIHRILGSPQDQMILKTLESKQNTIQQVV
jgi:SNF2 family DNA or RNA helicase